MLLVLGIIVSLCALAVFVMIAWANGMSDSPSSRESLWPAVVLALFAVGIFVARHFLHGKALTW